ncbi:MAG: TlpA family protein disulfide reductase [Acidobacteria bacterium]|nr:TlpA family protein disulfide reductase [Acidobacteriota bacterium]
MLFRNLKLIAFVVALLVFAATATPEQSQAASIIPPVLEDIPELPAPDGSSDTPEIEVVMLDGKKLKLSSLRGKVCVIDMFASWCPHCQDHAPHMVKVYNQFKAQGFEIISLATDQKDKIADVKKFVKDYGLNYPVGFLTNEVMAYYMDSHSHNIPQVVLFGKNGKMLKRWIGWSEERTTELTSLVGEELKGAASTSSTTAPETKPVAAPAKETAAKPAAAKPPTRRKK